MSSSARKEITAFGAGAIGLVLVLAASYYESLRGVGSAWLFNWLDAHGLVREAPMNKPTEVGPPSFFAFTDETAIERMLLLGLLLAGAAMWLALHAEQRRRGSVYTSAGFMCGALAAAAYQPVFGISCMLVGGAALVFVRRRSGA